MQSSKKIIILAKKLAKNSFDEATGAIDLEYVRGIVTTILESPECTRYVLLKRYQYFLEIEQANRTATIEYAGDCDVGIIHARMEQFARQKLQLRVLPVPELVAGLRVALGDRIWERSIRGDLEAIGRG
jgi:F0F1-type ATP synthase delta subunit